MLRDPCRIILAHHWVTLAPWQHILLTHGNKEVTDLLLPVLTSLFHVIQCFIFIHNICVHSCYFPGVIFAVYGCRMPKLPQ